MRLKPFVLVASLVAILASATLASAQAIVVMVPAGGGEQFDDIWVRPGHSKAIYVYVCLGDFSNPYCIPNLTLHPNGFGAYPQEGGHAGNHSGGPWPWGQLSPNDSTTGPNGEPAYFLYNAGPAGGMAWPAFWTEYQGWVYYISTINGFVVGETFTDYPDLGNGDFVRIGATIRHPDNHYGTSDLINSLHLLATDYKNRWPEHPVLAYNDMSLRKGGVFDIHGQYAGPHNTHRTGTNADVRANGLDNSIPEDTEVREWFENRVYEIFGLYPLHESEGTGNEHYHIFGGE